MSENLLIIDTAAIINLFAQRGVAGWDALFNTNKRVVVLDIMVEELESAVGSSIEKDKARIPADLDEQFKSWLGAESTKARGAIHVQYNAARNSIYRDGPERALKRDAGDQFIKSFIEGQDAGAMAARAIDIRTPQGARLTATANVTFQKGAVRRTLGHKSCRRASLGIMTGKPEFALLSRR
ncbi:hypothetical protein [Agrobacterium sp. NPDC090283]|uniref:hypothetical protein n=1 Tax=Agrobacterium sp. NPDC090283 TaxID=3363920 RepID=UPI00383A306F